ncbi:MAG: hypothetical protein QM831_20340 [Kofleriaceae bacterium]
MKRTTAYLTSFVLVVAAWFNAYHAASVDHVRDRHGHLVHATSVGEPGHTHEGFHAARGISAEADECAFTGVQQNAAPSRASIDLVSRTHVFALALAPLTSRRSSTIYRHAPKTSPPTLI